MALKPQALSINLAGGLELKTEPKQVQPPNTLVADNVVFSENRNVRKRKGAEQVVPLSSVATAMVSYDDNRLIYATSNGIYEHNAGGETLLAATDDVGITITPFATTKVIGGNYYVITTPPSTVYFADLGDVRCVVSEGSHNTNNYYATDSGGNARQFDLGTTITVYFVGKTGGKVAYQYTLAGREVSVKIHNNRFFVSYVSTANASVVVSYDATGATSTVSTGGNVAVSAPSNSQPLYTDLCEANGYLFHVVAVSDSDIRLSYSLPSSNNFNNATGTIPFFNNPHVSLETARHINVKATPTQISQATNKFAIHISSFKGSVAALFDTTFYTVTATAWVNYATYLQVPFDNFLYPYSSGNTVTGLISDGNQVIPFTHNFVTATLTHGTPVAVAVNGSSMTYNIATPVKQDDVTKSDARLFPGGIFAQLRSKIFIDSNGLASIWVAHTDGLYQSVDYLVAIPSSTPRNPRAAIFYNSVNIVPVNKNISNSTDFTGRYIINGHAGDATAADFYETTIASLANSAYTISNVTRNSFNRQLIKVPNGLITAGAFNLYYDGSTARIPVASNTPNFHLTAVTNGGTLNPTEVANDNNLAYPAGGAFEYTYYAVSVSYDAQGNAIYSPVSAPMKVTLSGTQNAVLFDDVILGPYIDKIQFYRNSLVDPTGYVRVNLTKVSSPSSGYQDYGNDNNNDKLYSPPSGGELQNDPLPSITTGISAVDRLYAVPSDDPTSIIYSKPYREGRAFEFNADQRFQVAPEGGPNVALAIMDQVLYIFKPRRIYALPIGQGPDATGSGTFGQIALIASDVGCTDADSLVLSPQGVFFRSSRGLQLLSPGQGVAYVGAPIEPLIAGRTVVDSTVVPAMNQCRFALDDGTLLVYDHFLSRWSTYSGWGPQASTIHQGVYWFANAGIVRGLCRETNDYVDVNVQGLNAFNYPMKIVTPWIPLGPGPQAWGRLRRLAVLGDFKSPHSLNCSIAFDYDPTVAYTIVAKADGTTPYEWRIRSPRQVGTAVQFTFTDSAMTGTGESFALSDITLEIEPKQSMLRTPYNRSL